MFRILFVTLFMVFIVHPASAGPQERANALFVEAAKLIQAATNETDVEVRLDQLTEAQGNFQRIIEDYPSSNLAVKLISGQSIGAYSLGSMQVAVGRAYAEVLVEQSRIAAVKIEERSRIAAMKIEGVPSQLAEIQTLEEGKSLAKEFDALMAQLQSKYGPTNYLRDLSSQFDDQYENSFNPTFPR